jgi:hypothetical protein
MSGMVIKLKFKIIIFILTCLAILSADLIITLINKYVMSYNGIIDKHYVTLAGIGVVLVIFYILVSNINKLSEKLVNSFVHATRRIIGRVIGLYIAIIALALIIFSGYYWAWFNKNFFGEIWGFLKSLL